MGPRVSSPSLHGRLQGTPEPGRSASSTFATLMTSSAASTSKTGGKTASPTVDHPPVLSTHQGRSARRKTQGRRLVVRGRPRVAKARARKAGHRRFREADLLTMAQGSIITPGRHRQSPGALGTHRMALRGVAGASKAPSAKTSTARTASTAVVAPSQAGFQGSKAAGSKKAVRHPVRPLGSKNASTVRNLRTDSPNTMRIRPHVLPGQPSVREPLTPPSRRPAVRSPAIRTPDSTQFPAAPPGASHRQAESRGGPTIPERTGGRPATPAPTSASPLTTGDTKANAARSLPGSQESTVWANRQVAHRQVAHRSMASASDPALRAAKSATAKTPPEPEFSTGVSSTIKDTTNSIFTPPKARKAAGVRSGSPPGSDSFSVSKGSQTNAVVPSGTKGPNDPMPSFLRSSAPKTFSSSSVSVEPHVSSLVAAPPPSSAARSRRMATAQRIAARWALRRKSAAFRGSSTPSKKAMTGSLRSGEETSRVGWAPNPSSSPSANGQDASSLPRTPSARAGVDPGPPSEWQVQQQQQTTGTVLTARHQADAAAVRADITPHTITLTTPADGAPWQQQLPQHLDLLRAALRQQGAGQQAHIQADVRGQSDAHPSPYAPQEHGASRRSASPPSQPAWESSLELPSVNAADSTVHWESRA